ncbi:MAG: hypothetical protein ACKVU4_04450 [Phycisphaerales bacterium]
MNANRASRSRMVRTGSGVAVIMLGASAGQAAAGGPLPVRVELRPENIRMLRVSPGGIAGGSPRASDGECFEYATHTQHQFINEPPNTPVTIQAGFAEGEIAAASYTLPANMFPIRLSSIEMLFATTASVQTTTQWSVLVWTGPPTNGQPIAEYSSDGVELPHLTMPAAFGGAQGTVIQFAIDPGDPEQIIIPANPFNSFTVAFRIDNHHNGPANACTTSPPINSNAFPTTDVNGLQAAFGNWIKALNCGGLACPGGWFTFGAYPLICRPSGDWILRAQWEPQSCGGSCYPDCTNDGSLSVADFGCFQGKYAMNDMYADCNESGALTIADFGCFQGKYVLGCP